MSTCLDIKICDSTKNSIIDRFSSDMIQIQKLLSSNCLGQIEFAPLLE